MQNEHVKRREAEQRKSREKQRKTTGRGSESESVTSKVR
jgi:hypothetical protein